MTNSEIEWLKSFLANIPLGKKLNSSMPIHCDCQQTITITKNNNCNGKNRYIQFKMLFNT